MEKKFRKGQTIYCQGQWRCRCVSDDGYSISYVALEGFESSYDGGTLTAVKSLFSAKKDKNWGKP